MASGGGNPFRKPSATDPRQKSWQRTTSASDKDDNISLNSLPNDLRPNNWDFSDWQPSSASFDNAKRRKKGNPEREREQSLSQDSPPPSERQHRTPSTYPRTRITPSTPTSQRVALENLKQQLTFSDYDDASNDGERNNERSVPIRRGRPPNFTRQDTSSTEGASWSRNDTSQQRSRNIASPNVDDLFSDTGPNSGQIVGRLMQIREYIKQANMMMEALNKSGDPQAHREDLGKLRKLAESLQEQENSYLGLLQQALTMKVENADVDGTNDRDDIPRPDSAEDRQSVDIDVKSDSDETATERSPSGSSRPRIEDKLGLSEEEEVDDGVSPFSDNIDRTLVNGQSYDEDNDVERVDSNSDLMALRQQQELLKKLLQQKEQMTALKERQKALIALQKDAESKLAEARAYEASMNSLGGQSAPQRQSRPAADNLFGNESDGTPGSLQEIRKHFNLLRNELKETTSAGRKEERPAENVRPSNPAIEAAAAEAASALDDNRKQLQNKLQELHEKKQKMDSLLQELQVLRSQRVDDLMNNQLQDNSSGAGVPRTQSEVRISESQAATQHAEATEEDAAEVLKMLEAEEKLRKLKEVKERLNQLKSLMQYYQTTDGAESENRQGVEIPVEYSQSQVNNEQQMREIPVERATEMEARSEEDNKSDSSSTTEEGTESHLSSLGPWGDDPEIQEKVRKLKAAKDKLKQLQDLVSMVQHSPDAAGSLPENLMELAGSLDDGDYVEGVDKGTELSEGEIPNTQEERDTFYAAKMQEQMDELDQLKTERQRLLSIQQELQSLNSRFPSVQVEVAANDEDEEEEEEVVEVEPTRKRTKQTAAKQASDDQEVEGSDRAPVVTFSSNDEVYDKMRRQRMLREELRQKKKEVEAIMKKDGSRKSYGKNQDAQSDTVSFSTDAFGGAMSADATMATWGGSTVDNMESITEDGVDGNQASDNEEEDDGYPSDGIVQVEEEEEEFDNETYTIENDVRQRRMARADKTTKQRTYPRSRTEPKGGARPKQRSFTKKQKKSRQRQENFRSAEEIVQDEDYEEKPASLQEQIDRLTNLCQSLLQRENPTNLLQPANNGYGYQQNPDLQQQLQQQQTLMMNQCLQQMCMQQLELQNLQRQMNMFIDPYGGDLRLRSLQSLPTDSRNMSPNLESRQNPFSVQPQFPPSFYGRRSNDSSPQINTDNLSTNNRQSYSQSNSKKPSSSRNKNLYDQYLRQEKRESTGRPSRNVESSQEESPLLQLNIDDPRNRRKFNQQKDWSTVSLASESKHESGKKSPDRPERDPDDDVTRRGLSARARQLLEDMYRPGLSAGISGAGFRENISIASTSSRQPQDNPDKETRESEDGIDLSLFEALREGIYSEVATLISQNENRPHFLIELFRELQKLNTDYLRQRALYAIRDVGSKYLSDQNNDMSATAPPPAWMNTDAVNKCSDTESTPSESIITTDIETDTREQQRSQLQKNILRMGSIANDAFDYIENADNDSSLSTPSNSYWESNPFAQDSLGDTAINLNKALQKMRECEKKMAAEEAKIKNLENSRLNREMSEACSSSALDQGSDRESSVSSISPKIDTQVVDRQIKSIMTEIIPVIKQHMDNVCSSELLTYIKRLVLSLTRQRDGTSQYARFYHTQLGSSLQDTLSKFEGRKMRECGEDLLVDMSEVLFNELAFFKLMQGIVDVPITSDKEQQTNQLRTSSTQTGDEGGQEEEEDGSDRTPESDTSTTTDEEDVNRSVKMMDNEEEEELGKSRDDDFANEVEVKDSEDKDEDTESPYKTSPVHIELAVSEMTPFTRIGSDEDDEDADESQSAEDPSETAVSRDAMMERSHDTDEGMADGMPDEESFVKISKEDADQGADNSKDSKSVEAQYNGEVLMNGEITIEDLPPTLDVCQNGIQQRLQEEQANNSGTTAVLSSIDTQQELAGDGLFLKEPDELKTE